MVKQYKVGIGAIGSPPGVLYAIEKPIIKDHAVVIQTSETITEVYYLASYPQIVWEWARDGWDEKTGGKIIGDFNV